MTSPAIKLARECGFSEAQWKAMTYDTGPYEITKPTYALARFYAKAQAQALDDAAKKFRGEIGYNFVAADGYSSALDIATELEFMAEELRRGA